ncbi:small multi-drug export protein [Tissierella sp.]|uniref:COG2426 family protein n=1 Tax=Tissierella sp. TaxID=41274 RepID=UPI0028AC11EB|nr:small multi-drug export protein [Tissierella sp.]
MWELIEELQIEIMVIFFAMMPIVELRGAIPLGISLGLSPLHSTILSIIGNIIIVPFLLKLLQPIMKYFEKTVVFSNTIGWVKRRSMKKANIIKKYSLIGLFIFVAIPVPTTGVWTGSIIASILKLDFKKALLSISLGIITAGAIVATISYQVFSLF